MPLFRKKPLVIEAIKFNGNSNINEIVAFVGRKLTTALESETAYLAGVAAPVFSLFIETKEGVMKAFRGDWIIKEPFATEDRKFYPCKPDIFEKTYEPIEDIPESPVCFEKELEQLINKHSQENGSNTPDFILADYLCRCLSAFNSIIEKREKWYGVRVD